MLGTPAVLRRASGLVVLALLALVATLLPGAVGQAQAQESPVGARVGFSNGGGFPWLSDANLARELDLMAQAGTSWIRVDFDWSGVEGTRGRYNWSNLDRVVGAIHARGMKVLALPAYTPSWARPAGTTTHHPPTDPSHFAAFAGAAAARYVPQGVTVWEIWNEPNIPNFWEPKPDVAGYVELLRRASAAIRQAAPGTTIVTGGLSPASDTSDGRYVDPRTFISKMYALGARSSFDAIGVHPYSFPALPSDVKTASWNTFQKMTTMRETMVANGDSAKKIWLTETGAPTGTSSAAVSEQVQADIITDTLRATEGLSWAGPVFLYAARDGGTDPTDREDNFGLVRKDFSPKLAWDALVTALRGTSSGLTPTPGTGSVVTGPAAVAPAAPATLSARGHRTGITVTWAASTGATRYVLERTTQAPSAPVREWSRIATTDAASLHHVDRTTTGFLRYYYRVQAANVAGTSPSSPEASASVGRVLRARYQTSTSTGGEVFGPRLQVLRR